MGNSVDAVEKLIRAFEGRRWKYRVRLKSEVEKPAWSAWIIVPVSGWVEPEMQGPYNLSEMTQLEIQPVEMRHIGRLLPAVKTDFSEALTTMLEQYGIDYHLKAGIFSIMIEDPAR